MTQKTTLAEFKDNFDCSGESVMNAAFYAQYITDDPEFAAAARAAVAAEDRFAQMLEQREVVL